jgi:predicted nucleic acid-binding protein
MSVLIDTNILLALAFPRDVNHENARVAMRELTDERVIVAPVLPELFYLVQQRMDYSRAIQSFELITSNAFRIEPLSSADMRRMRQIMHDYQDNTFDFVDTALMAVAERLKITKIYTFDRRDFQVFQPKHYPYLMLLP